MGSVGVGWWAEAHPTYLLFPIDEMLPSWLPADLFEVIDQRLPFEWYFRYFSDKPSNQIKILIGYKELVLDEAHYNDLIEVDRKAIRIFLTRKKEIDEES